MVVITPKQSDFGFVSWWTKLPGEQWKTIGRGADDATLLTDALAETRTHGGIVCIRRIGELPPDLSPRIQAGGITIPLRENLAA